MENRGFGKRRHYRKKWTSESRSTRGREMKSTQNTLREKREEVKKGVRQNGLWRDEGERKRLKQKKRRRRRRRKLNKYCRNYHHTHCNDTTTHSSRTLGREAGLDRIKPCSSSNFFYEGKKLR